MAKSSGDETLDLLIVDAGIYGISAANTYLTLHPKANIRILDVDDDVGGVWSRSRLYPKFWSQSPARLVGFHDIPFKLPPEADTYYDLFEAKHVTHYLEDYVSNQEYNGHSLRDRLVTRCLARHVRKSGSREWLVEAEKESKHVVYKCAKLIVAIGLTENPNMPSFRDQEKFKGILIHQKHFGSWKLFTPEEQDIKDHTHITVLGGAKSAADMVYAAAIDTFPRKVCCIMRKSGLGPLLLESPKGFWKYRSAPEVGSTRAIAMMSSADPFVRETWWSRFLHKTAVGEWLLGEFWSQTEHDATALANFENREGSLPSFEKLRSHTKLRWLSGPLGLVQRDEFWDVVARKVRVYRRDVLRLKQGAIQLADGTEVPTDVLLCGTGWVPDRPSFDSGEAARLGLPNPLKDSGLPPADRERWEELDNAAGCEVIQRWPYLQQSTEFFHGDQHTTPYRLYNGCMPIDDRSIAFLGIFQLPNHFLAALVQSLWAIAVLDGTLNLPQSKSWRDGSPSSTPGADGDIL